MKVNVLKPTEIEVKVGDKVEVDFQYEYYRRRLVIKRLVETRHKTYAVFNNHTYRPFTSYGKTWRKVGE